VATNVVDGSKLFIEIALSEDVSNRFQKAKDFLNETTGKTVNTLTEATNRSLGSISERTQKATSSWNETVGRAVDTVSTTAEQTKHSLTAATANAVNQVTAASSQAVDTLAEVTQRTKGSLHETVAKATEVVAEKTSKAVYTVTQTAEQAKHSLTQTTVKAVDNVSVATGKAVNTITETANQAEDSIVETFEKTKTSLEDSLKKAEHLSAVASTAIEKAINDFINHQMDAVNAWINAHPATAWVIKALLWAINHPISSIVIILLAAFILWKLFTAFSRFLEQGLLFTLKFPLKFGQSFLNLSFKALAKFAFSALKIKQSKSKDLALDTSIADSSSQKHKPQLAKLITKLEAIRQEQNDILQEITAIVGSNR